MRKFRAGKSRQVIQSRNGKRLIEVKKPAKVLIQASEITENLAEISEKLPFIPSHRRLPDDISTDTSDDESCGASAS